MRVLGTHSNISWLPKPNKIKEVLSSTLPPIEEITTVFGLVTYQKKILVANLYRDWDLPGGHREEGESLEDTLAREIEEETSIRIKNPTLIGYQQMELFAPKPERYRYPYPISYQLHYHAEICEIKQFSEDEETFGRDFFCYEEIAKLPNLQLRLNLVRHVFSQFT